MKFLISVFKTLLIIFITLLFVFPQFFMAFIPFWKNKPYWMLPKLWYKVASRILGMKVIKTGKDIGRSQKKAGVIYTSNHVSYLDILVHGSWMNGLFVAKSDIASWPIFGFLAKLQGVFFVERRPSAAKEQKEKLEHYLFNGVRLMMFPEGTTSNGWEVKPFKSSLFGAAISEDTDHKREIYVQPVSIAYTHLDGKKINHTSSEFVAWYGDAELIPHLWELFHHRKIVCHLHFHEALRVRDFGDDRKSLAHACEIAVRQKTYDFLDIKEQEKDQEKEMV